jgi:cytosine deaminase
MNVVPPAPPVPPAPAAARSPAFVAVPAATAYRIANARVPVDLAPALADHAAGDRFAACDIFVADGRIAALVPSAPAPPGAARNAAVTLSAAPPSALPDSASLPTLDLRGGIVLPRFVDVHTHIDKGHIWPRRPNPDGTHAGARAAVMADRQANWSADDVRARMDFSLRCALAHGTGALRTHIDSLGKQAAISWPVLAEMREAWRGRIALQGVAIFPVELAVDDEPQFRALVQTVVRHGGVLGGVTFLGEAPGPKLELALDRLFGIAAANGLDLDLHVDESSAPHARSLARIAEAALRHRFAGRIVAGHCCALAQASDEERARTIARVAEAGIAVVSLPMCNMYLQDRVAGRTPRLRGVAPLHELDAAGIAVMVASDNTRDPFYAYGDLDMLEVFREAARILHLDHSDRPWLRLMSAASADVMGLDGGGLIAAGGRADLVLTRARTFHELMCRPQSDRAVVVAGRAIDTTLPDYGELDHLAGGAASPAAPMSATPARAAP